MASRRPRVFMGLMEVSGYYTHLKRGFEAIGIRSTFVSASKHAFGYGDESRFVVRLLQRVTGWRPPGTVRPLLRAIAIVALRSVLLVSALPRHDVFIFGYFNSFLFLLDLPLLKFAGKKVICVLHGSDSRPAYLDGFQMRDEPPEKIARAARKQKWRIGMAERFADAIVCTPIHTHLHTRAVVKFQSIGLPILPPQSGSDYAAPAQNGGVVRIVHAPSDPRAKGTEVIRAAVANLRSRGYSIDFIELIGRSNAEVIRTLAECDFVVDQLNGEGPCGGFATEAAFFAKPAIVGTHTDDVWRMFRPSELPPVYRCANDDVESAIERLIVDDALRRELGLKACEFVRDVWHPVRVAERFLTIVEGNVPEEWTYHPRDLRYVHGAGFTEQGVRQVLREYIRTMGVEALHVADKPELERALVEFAEQRC